MAATHIPRMKGKQLRSLRKRLGWTQIDMAKTLRTTANTVARWERDERSITEKTALLIQMVYEREKKAR